ncbi:MULTISPECIES: antitoxin [Acinetobacter]|uniref:antitoxin n=1 Tax=Acinetobacter TaxID=469 RepID=UPI000C2C73EF|nr:AbrB/MazE/SpoVT family DNA-binding domain-containing protein [Acinetobacter haemolyticus]ATZ68184.1 antitoxin [Acinetobacter haemolyticus]NAS09870.1 AbrB/MazE/SpoVT family DNA-binding domain-containing protein [Acinetobacter haemolyticus]RSN77817.1 AbrB/MazE/SpoVT family DNA-binding domain-containing protein [Acinetobacter haemolyticus]
MSNTAFNSRVFMNGNSQAIRIPQELRLNTRQVTISKAENGDLVIHPLPENQENRGETLLQILQGFDDDFVEILEKNRLEDNIIQEREAL